MPQKSQSKGYILETQEQMGNRKVYVSLFLCIYILDFETNTNYSIICR